MRRQKLDKTEVVAKFKRDAKRGELIGNDFLRVATVGDADLCPYLRTLKAQMRWCDDDDAPWGRWVTVLCEWFENGSDGLVRISKGARGHVYIGMCLGVLANHRSSENLATMARIIPLRFQLPTDPHQCETVSSWCMELVQFLNVSRPLKIDPETEGRLRRFAHSFVKKGLRKSQKRDKAGNQERNSRYPSASELFYFAPGMALLAHVGNEESIELIQRLPQSATSEKKLEVIQRIKSRAGV